MPLDGNRLGLVLGLTLGCGSVMATSANKAAFSRFFGEHLPVSLQSCATCHVRADAHGATSLEDFPHNPFGDALARLGAKVPMEQRLQSILEQDADGDGSNNLEEILAGSRPGSPDQKERATEAQLAEFHAYLGRYPWRPFSPVVRPEVPQLTDWGRNPIDAFIAQGHQAHGLRPRPEASRERWLRRVHLDLTGLLPTLEERRLFLEDTSPQAYERVVDRLLESPAHGERWARHWMDIWRYSDWAGYKDALRDSQRHIWHWRDWIVEALNADKGYDRMLQEMLAGDELAPEDPDTLRATGFVARNFFTERNQSLDNLVSHVSQGLLGITLGCAKCHDHMYDPFTMEDYYSLRAVFEPFQTRTDKVAGELDVMKAGIPRVYDASTTAKTYMFERGDERYPIRDRVIDPHPPAALGGNYQPAPLELPLLASRPDQRETVRKTLLAQQRELVQKTDTPESREAAERRLEALQAEFGLEDLQAAGTSKGKTWETAATELTRLQNEADLLEARLKQGSSQAALAKAEKALEAAKEAQNKTTISKAETALASARKALASADKAVTDAEKAVQSPPSTKYKPRKQDTFPATSSGRRLAFARWMTDRQNPLVARVAVNHLWTRHFGRGLVTTPNEFGAHGNPPSHPELLDWLAAEFMEQGWSLKAMHRLMVLSATYRMDSTPDDSNATRDPDNIQLWRMPSQRMEGEIVRDNLLHLAGQLSREMGGPDLPNDQALKLNRRSLYFRHAHEKLVEFIQIFDGPKVTECYQREVTVQPRQALALANSPLTFGPARELAGRIDARWPEARDFTREAFVQILGREPDSEELSLCLDFLQENSDRSNLVMVLLNHNDFVTIR